MIIQLATEVNLSPSRLRVLFKAETGQTIPQFARGLRLEKARQLVVGTFFRISEIATQLDYDDPSQFVREFRKTFGVTPLIYRRINTTGHEQSPQPMNSHFRP